MGKVFPQADHDVKSVGKAGMVQDVTDWLLQGDPAIVYQTQRDLLHLSSAKVWKTQQATARTGWGRPFLDQQRPDGHWGRGACQPKWIRTDYTLLDLKLLGICAEDQASRKAANLLLASKVEYQETRGSYRRDSRKARK